MPKANRSWRVIGRLRARAPEAIAILACLFFAGVAFWEAFGPLSCGHFCSAAAVAIAGDNMLRLSQLVAVPNYFIGPPPESSYYFHHPFGVFMSSAVAHAVFGHGEFTVRAPGAFYGTLTPPLIWAVSRAIWGRWAAAAATLAFVLVPINLAFAQFVNLEVVTIFWGLVFTWGTVRLWQTWRWRYQIIAVLGAIGTCHGDWIGFVLIGLVAGFAMVRAYFVPARWFGPTNERQHARWLALMVAVCVFTICWYLFLIGKAHRFDDLLGAYNLRSAGSSSPLDAIRAPRRWMWLEWTLPILASATMALALPVSLWRLARGAALQCFLPIWILTATVQYVAFRQGADIHVFWPHYYGVPIAFSCALLVREVGRAWHWLSLKLGVRARRWLKPALGSTALLLAAGYFVILGRMGLMQLHQSKLTGGQFDEGGKYISSGREFSVFVEWAMQAIPESSDLALAWFPRLPIAEYTGGRGTREVSLSRTSPDASDRFALVDTRRAPQAELSQAAKQFSVIAAGPFWRVDRASTHQPIEAVHFEQRQPRGLERYLQTGTDLMRTVGGLDPWASWEWQDFLGETTTDREPAEPRTPEQIRIAHNMAVKRGDRKRAEALSRLISRGIQRRLDARITDTSTLLGVSVERGVVPVASLYWQMSAQFKPHDADFHVRSRVIAEPPLWWSAVDFYEKEVAPPGSAAFASWKPGFIHIQSFVVLKRIGRETFEGFLSTSPGGARIPLFTLD